MDVHTSGNSSKYKLKTKNYVKKVGVHNCITVDVVIAEETNYPQVRTVLHIQTIKTLAK
jgi:hypothetical protein